MVVCRTLLNRDPEKRPSAQEALNHPWLQGDVSDRSKGKPLSFQVSAPSYAVGMFQVRMLLQLPTHPHPHLPALSCH